MSFTFITGATGGIGKAFAIELAKRGNNLFLTGRSQQKLTELKNSLSPFNVKVITYPLDLTNQQERKEFFAVFLQGKALKDPKRNDILHHIILSTIRKENFYETGNRTQTVRN